MWWTKHPNAFALISKELDDRISQSREGREERIWETGIVGKSQGTQKNKGGSGGHLHLRGPSCVVLMFYTAQKKEYCTFFVVGKGKVVFILTLRECLQKKISARNRVKMVVPAVLSWKTKLKKPQRERNCLTTKNESKSCVPMAWCVYGSPADFTWMSGWMFVSSGSQPIVDRCVPL